MAPSQRFPRHLCLAAMVVVPAAASVDGAALVQSALRAHADADGDDAPGAARPAGPKRAHASQGWSEEQVAQWRKSLPDFKHKPDRGDVVIASKSRHSVSDEDATIDVVVKRAKCADCTIHWGEKTAAAVKMHVPRGLQKDDKLAMQFNADLHVADDTNPWNLLLPFENTKINRICEFCDGACILDAKTVSNVSVDARFPSPYNTESICEGMEDSGLTLKKNMKDINLEQFDLELPLRENGLTHIEGRVDATVSLLRRNGHTKAAVTTAFKFSPSGDAEEFNLVREEGRGISADAEEGWEEVKVEEVEAATAEQQTGSFAQDVAVIGSKLASGLKAVAAANKQLVNLQRETEARPGHVYGVDWKYTNIAGEPTRGHFNLTMDPGCKALDDNGSRFCRLAFDQMQSGSISMRLNANFDMGSVLRLQLRPRSRDEKAAKILAELGADLHMDYEWPVCGRHSQVWQDNKYFKAIMQACGPTTLNVDVPFRHFYQLGTEHFPIHIYDILMHFPKVTLLADFQLLHPDESVIWHFSLEGALIH